MNIFTDLKKDFSLSATIAGLIVIIVGMSSSAVVVFQAAQAFGANAAEAGSWLGSLCIGMGVLTLYYSIKYKNPILMAWSTPGAVLLVTAAQGFSLSEAIGAFIFSSVLVFLFGATGLFEKVIDKISLSLTSALLAGVLFHFCIDVLSVFKLNSILVGVMFVAYIVGRKFWSQLSMLLVLAAGLLASVYLDLFKVDQIEFSLTQFQFVKPLFTMTSIISIGIPFFIVTMASQNLTGISVMRAHQYNNPISSLLTGMGLMSVVTSFFGGFSVNFAAITAAIGMGPEAHPDSKKRYIAAVVSGLGYILIGLFAGTVTSFFAAFPKAMVSTVAGLALLGTVRAGLEKSFENTDQKEASFITFMMAASGISFFGISSAFWAIVVGLLTQIVLKKRA